MSRSNLHLEESGSQGRLKRNETVNTKLYKQDMMDD
jgi:hypothetical protein